MKVINLFQEMIKDSSSYFEHTSTEDEFEFYEHLKIINLYFVLKIADLYQKKILESSIKRAQTKNIDVSIFDSKINQNSNKYLDMIKDRDWPELSKHRMFRKLRNQIATRVRSDGLVRRDLCEVDFSRSIILTGVNPLASRFSKKVVKPVSLITLFDFFSGANSTDINEMLKRSESEYFNTRIFNEYVQIFTNILGGQGVELSSADFSEIYDWHKDFSLCVSYYQKLLKKRTSSLPKNLWTTSGGILWNKILAIEVRKKGGVVTGFDHAEGATLSTETLVPFIELQDVDVFVTHSETFVSYLKEASKHQLYTSNYPDIISINDE